MSEQQVENRAALMGTIKGLGHTDEMVSEAKIIPKSSTPVKTPTGKGGVLGFGTGEDGTLKEEWDTWLPRPPSMKLIEVDEYEGAEQVAVFNANTHEGSTMVRVLSEKGLRVVAAVRVFTSKNTKQLIKLKGVTVKVADWSDEKSLLKVAEGCSRAFLVTKYWETFDSRLEEQMATNILRACARVQPPIKHLVLATFEDTKELIVRGRKSQLVPTRDGRIFPTFEGMNNIDLSAKEWGVQITHMMTSYLDEENEKKSLILIRGENGRIIVQPYIQNDKNTMKMKTYQ